MSYQGTATISRVAQEIEEQLEGTEWEFLIPNVRSMIRECDVLPTDDYDSWVELSFQRPGDLEEYPHIVYCVCSYEPGAVTAKTYKPIS